MAAPIRHVFVLMMENRSFDHMLGFSGITGTDAVTGQQTRLAGLRGDEFNTYSGVPYPVTSPAHNTMPVGPHHDFADVLLQLTGIDVTAPGGHKPLPDSNYPPSPSQASSTAMSPPRRRPRLAISTLAN
ncbi:Phospholipase C 4 precursor [Myxococcus hansupus]|uniref:Phospholipase C 4 n=1 Tax=Pseudomyxococcus hansupus TaxID=1297742 RepID=A0A0H4WTF8_9BACT|nr:alkaline phosphatase family protein [Myxococcus hansupus]AKQ64600.1 Phospholipase C 4 precursor [Myxococcus hansupus]